MKLRWKILIGAIVLITLDQALTRYADYRIRSRDADFFERYAEVELNWSGPSTQACAFKYELWIYPYQTCFRFGVMRWESTDSFVYAYSKPRPRLAIIGRGDTPNNYYFENLGGNDFVIQVTKDGHIYNYDTGDRISDERY